MVAGGTIGLLEAMLGIENLGHIIQDTTGAAHGAHDLSTLFTHQDASKA